MGAVEGAKADPFFPTSLWIGPGGEITGGEQGGGDHDACDVSGDDIGQPPADQRPVQEVFDYQGDEDEGDRQQN